MSTLVTLVTLVLTDLGETEATETSAWTKMYKTVDTSYSNTMFSVSAFGFADCFCFLGKNTCGSRVIFVFSCVGMSTPSCSMVCPAYQICLSKHSRCFWWFSLSLFMFLNLNSTHDHAKIIKIVLADGSFSIVYDEISVWKTPCAVLVGRCVVFVLVARSRVGWLCNWFCHMEP